MKKFKDLIGSKSSIYSVSENGSIKKWDNVEIEKFKVFHHKTGITEVFAHFKNGPFMRIENLDSNKAGLTKNGNVSSSWGYAVFIDANEAAELATRIVTTKYNNSIKQIKEVTNT